MTIILSFLKTFILTFARLLLGEERNILTKSLTRNSIFYIFSSRPHGKIFDCISHIKDKTFLCIKFPWYYTNSSLWFGVIEKLIITGNWRFPVRFFVSPRGKNKKRKRGGKLKFTKFSSFCFNSSVSCRELYGRKYIKTIFCIAKVMVTSKQWFSLHIISHVYPPIDTNDMSTLHVTEFYRRSIGGSVLFLHWFYRRPSGEPSYQLSLDKFDASFFRTRKVELP